MDEILKCGHSNESERTLTKAVLSHSAIFCAQEWWSRVCARNQGLTKHTIETLVKRVFIIYGARSESPNN